MLYEQYEKLTKHNVLIYLILSLWMLLVSVIFLKKAIDGMSLEILCCIYPFFLFLAGTDILRSVLDYYIVLRLLKINASYKLLHNRIVVIKIFECMFSQIFSLFFTDYEILWRTAGAIIAVIGLLCIVYVLNKTYIMSRKQKNILVILVLFFEIISRILVLVLK